MALAEHVGETEVALGVPGPALRAFVKGTYTGFAESSGAPRRRRELPFGGVAVILALEHEWWIGDDVAPGTPLVRHTSFIGGLIDTAVVSEHRGAALSLQFDLTPLGARALLGVPGRDLANRVVPFEDVVGLAGVRLVEELAATVGWPTRFAMLDAFLQRRILGAPPVSPDVAWAWGRLAASDGAVAIGTLTDELGCSRRHLAARFGHEVGMTPKAFGRLLRFERAVDRLRTGDDELTRIAGDCGYADQAHFTRELRAFAGVPPTALLAERDGRGFVL